MPGLFPVCASTRLLLLMRKPVTGLRLLAIDVKGFIASMAVAAMLPCSKNFLLVFMVDEVGSGFTNGLQISI